MKKTICLDFDGVIHSYTSGWQGEENINDSPVFEARESINQLREMGHTVLVHSCRCKSASGRRAIEQYLLKHSIMVDGVCEHKPQADHYVDDRAIKFDGVWDEVVEQISEGTQTIQLGWNDIIRLISIQKNLGHNKYTDNTTHGGSNHSDQTVNMLNELFKEELAEAKRYLEEDEGAIIH